MDDMQEAIRLQLDAALLEEIEAQEIEQETRRAHDNASQKVNALDAQAQRLRMALYALAGDKAGLGDANGANHKRRQELLREQREQR